MADFTWYGYMGTTPDWVDIDTNTVVFSGSATQHDVAITLNTWNSGTHVGNGDPGTDQCGANHMRNVKYVSNTEFDSGSGTETLNDTNLVATECTMKVMFTDTSSVVTSSGKFYTFDGSTTTNEAVGIEAYAFEQGKGNTSWAQINDDSANLGGYNDAMALGDQTTATEHTYFIAISARPEQVGDHTEFDMGIAVIYS